MKPPLELSQNMFLTIGVPQLTRQETAVVGGFIHAVDPGTTWV